MSSSRGRAVIVVWGCVALVLVAVWILRGVRWPGDVETVQQEGPTASVAASQPAPTGTRPARLVVTKAVYGDLPDGANLDVTTQVAGLVDHDVLSMTADNSFGDPAEGVTKKLHVEFALDGVAGERTVNEGSPLRIAPSTGKAARLMIVKAEYGNFPKGLEADVTARIRELVEGDSVSVEATNAFFGDPAPGEVKALRVEYQFDGKSEVKEADEGETLTITE